MQNHGFSCPTSPFGQEADDDHLLPQLEVSILRMPVLMMIHLDLKTVIKTPSAQKYNFPLIIMV